MRGKSTTVSSSIFNLKQIRKDLDSQGWEESPCGGSAGEDDPCDLFAEEYRDDA